MLVGSSNTPSLTLSWTTRSCGVAAELRDPARPAMDHQLQHPQPHQGKSTGPEPDLCHWNINDRHFTKSLRMILEEEYFVLRHLQILLNQAFTSISSLDEFFVTLSPKANEHNDEKFDDESYVILTKHLGIARHNIVRKVTKLFHSVVEHMLSHFPSLSPWV